jgi:hypothetical protein
MKAKRDFQFAHELKGFQQSTLKRLAVLWNRIGRVQGGVEVIEKLARAVGMVYAERRV